MTLEPGGIIAWLVVGLVAGWLAGLVMKGGGYGLIGDIVVGIVGAFVGGFVFSLITGGGSAGFWGSQSRTCWTVAEPFSHSTSINLNSASVRVSDFLGGTKQSPCDY